MVHVYAYMFLYVCVGLCLYGGQRTILGVFLSWVPFTLLFWERLSHQDLGITDYARSAGLEPQGSICI